MGQFLCSQAAGYVSAWDPSCVQASLVAAGLIQGFPSTARSGPEETGPPTPPTPQFCLEYISGQPGFPMGHEIYWAL